MVGSRRFRLFIGIFIPFLTFFLMSQNTLNASAIEKRKNVLNRYINSVEWNYQGRDAQGNNANGAQSANLQYNTILSNVDLYAPLNGVATLINLKLNLRDNLTISRNKYFKINIFYQIEPEAFNSDLSIPLCPRGQGSVVVDECKITHIEDESQIYRIREELLNPSDNLSYSQVYNYAAYFYVMELIGHYEGNETTLSQLAFYNNFYNFYNSNAVLGHQKLSMFFSPVEQFEYVDSAEDEAAEKELEGTSNIENQTPQNTTGGTSENQQTTSIIGTISSFVGAFSNITPSQNCEMDLPFPDFVGGNQRVNICQGKDKAPALITAASSLLLIVTFVPVAFIVLSMIYKEIRSFTNG